MRLGLRAQPRAPAVSQADTRADRIMRRLNRNALHGREGNRIVLIEDHQDPDGRLYRLEYQCNPDGSNVTSFVRHNPWRNNPYPPTVSHLFENGQICMGNGGQALEEAISRARYFCTAYSYFRETGSFPNPS